MPEEMLEHKKLFIFDMDGTVYLGDSVFPFAVEYVKKLKAGGKEVLFFTNNASTDKEHYYKKLTGMGFPIRPDDIMTSADVTVEFLKKHRSGKSVYILGTRALVNSFVSAGIVVSEDADIVVSSFDKELTYEKLSKACTLIRGGAEYLCTHPDYNCPTEDGYIPDSGAIAAAITASTGVKPRFFGKPYKETVSLILSHTGSAAEDACIFGDRLYTDIALGKNSGITAVLVLSGEARIDDLADTKQESMPDVIIDSIKDLL